MPTKPRTKKPAAKPQRKPRAVRETEIEKLARFVADSTGRRIEELLSMKQESPITGWDTLMDVGLSAARVYDGPASACARAEPTDRLSPIEEAVARLLGAVCSSECLTDTTADLLKNIMSPPLPTTGEQLSAETIGASELASRLNGIADRIFADGRRRLDILNRLEL